jgi:quinol-cytochrome oxidoreductase complex cytochrome b subunit
LGGAAATLVALLMVSGALLKFSYVPTPDRAYASILALQHQVAFGRLIRNVHHWSANLLVLTVSLHLLRTFFTAAYTGRRRGNWLVGLVLFSLVLLANLTGYLLPWDQLAYWAITVCTAALAYLPGIGPWLKQLILGGPTLGTATLTHFFGLHTAILPVLFLLLLPYHFWCIRKAGGLAATAAKETRIEAVPHLLVREAAAALTVTAMVLMAAAVWDAPLGAVANPGLSPNPTKAPWYFAGFQELLLRHPPVVAVAVIPPLLALLLASLPFLPLGLTEPGKWFGNRPRGLKSVLTGALLALIWVPAETLAHDRWQGPMAGGTSMVGLGILLGLGVGFARRASARDGVQAAFTYVTATWLIYTIIGVWFRGPAMALTWPWQ